MTAADDGAELSIDSLAAAAGVPSRTIREYQTLGVLPPPQRRGRVGVYGTTHLRRLELIGRLQRRGYSLAGIRDLLTSWAEGDELGEVLGLAADELVHLDEPGAPATLDQLARLLPQLVPVRLEELVAVGLIEACGAERYCVASPSILRLTIDVLSAGYTSEQVLQLLAAIADAAERVAASAESLLLAPPDGLDDAALRRLTERGRGLLAHGVGRMTIHLLGRRLVDAGGAPGAHQLNPEPPSR